MSVYHNYTLTQTDHSIEPLETRLRESGAVTSGTMHGKDKEIPYDNILDYSFFNPELVQDIEKTIMESYPATTPEGLKNASKMPVTFENDGETMKWFVNHSGDDNPAFLISEAYPEETFRLSYVIENDLIYDIAIKNGKPLEDVKDSIKKNAVKTDIDR